MTIACYIRDEKLSRSIQETLTRAGLDCEGFLSETSLLRTMRRRNFSLILVDTGIETNIEENIFSWLHCRNGESTPVVVMSSLRSADRVAYALDAGADDFIAKPVDPIELVARLHAVIRRCKRQPDSRLIEMAGYKLDQDNGTVTDNGVQVELTPREFTMAWLLFSSRGQYLSRETISVAIWGVGSDIANRTIEQHVYKIRKKLNLSEERGVTIRTGYTQGYRLECVEKPVMA